MHTLIWRSKYLFILLLPNKYLNHILSLSALILTLVVEKINNVKRNKTA